MYRLRAFADNLILFWGGSLKKFELSMVTLEFNALAGSKINKQKKKMLTKIWKYKNKQFMNKTGFNIEKR